MVYTGRFAPSPTGDLHLGSLLAALGSWLEARAAGGQWLLRIDDLDTQRAAPASADRQQTQLARIGLVPDGRPLRQSTRGAAYAAALAQLEAAGLAYRCACSRSDLAARNGLHPERCIRPAREDGAFAWRLRVPQGLLGFDDHLQGRFALDLQRDVGDFVLRRADGMWAYQLAVVVDDAASGITAVVRGADLLESTPRQILLQRLLGLPTPTYLHLPVLVDAAGCKLSKSQGAAAIPAHPVEALRSALALLGQRRAAVAPASDAASLLRSALALYDRSALPRKRTLVAPQSAPSPAPRTLDPLSTATRSAS